MQVRVFHNLGKYGTKSRIPSPQHVVGCADPRDITTRSIFS